MPEETPSPFDGDAMDLYRRARARMDEGQLEEAVRLFWSSTKALPHWKAFELLGECLLRQDRIPDAVMCLAAAAGLGIRQSRSRYLLAVALLKAEAVPVEMAADQLVAAVQVTPGYQRAISLLSDIVRDHPELRQRLKMPREMKAGEHEP